ncbi:hypothetical protein XENTR_v10014162 [Xenopus tropicalis]|nr:hypothetical protein XENTR_v10014162 [Xenopus tropicalis]
MWVIHLACICLQIGSLGKIWPWKSFSLCWCFMCLFNRLCPGVGSAVALAGLVLVWNQPCGFFALGR